MEEDSACLELLRGILGRPASQHFQAVRKAAGEQPDLLQAVNRVDAMPLLQRLGQQWPEVFPCAWACLDAVTAGDSQRVLPGAGCGTGARQVQRAREQYLRGLRAQLVQRVQVFLAGQPVVQMRGGLVFQACEAVGCQPGKQFPQEGHDLGTAQFFIHHQTAEGQPAMRHEGVAMGIGRGAVTMLCGLQGCALPVGGQYRDDPAWVAFGVNHHGSVFETISVVFQVRAKKQEYAVATSQHAFIPCWAIVGRIETEGEHGRCRAVQWALMVRKS